jgi:hypothetical protein
VTDVSTLKGTTPVRMVRLRLRGSWRRDAIESRFPVALRHLTSRRGVSRLSALSRLGLARAAGSSRRLGAPTSLYTSPSAPPARPQGAGSARRDRAFWSAVPRGDEGQARVQGTSSNEK